MCAIVHNYQDVSQYVSNIIETVVRSKQGNDAFKHKYEHFDIVDSTHSVPPPAR